jgi:hypothetical protein
MSQKTRTVTRLRARSEVEKGGKKRVPNVFITSFYWGDWTVYISSTSKDVSANSWAGKAEAAKSKTQKNRKLVEMRGIDPRTSSMHYHLSYIPRLQFLFVLIILFNDGPLSAQRQGWSDKGLVELKGAGTLGQTHRRAQFAISCNHALSSLICCFLVMLGSIMPSLQSAPGLKFPQWNELNWICWWNWNPFLGPTTQYGPNVECRVWASLRKCRTQGPSAQQFKFRMFLPNTSWKK